MATKQWAKIKKDFFDRNDVRIIEALPNGKEYILFYLKMLCEGINPNEVTWVDDECLGELTNTDPDIVHGAMEALTEYGLIEKGD